MILDDAALRADWAAELEEVRSSMLGLRQKLADALRARTGSDRFGFIAEHRGMFSRIGATPGAGGAHARETRDLHGGRQPDEHRRAERRQYRHPRRRDRRRGRVSAEPDRGARRGPRVTRAGSDAVGGVVCFGGVLARRCLLRRLAALLALAPGIVPGRRNPARRERVDPERDRLHRLVRPAALVLDELALEFEPCHPAPGEVADQVVVDEHAGAELGEGLVEPGLVAPENAVVDLADVHRHRLAIERHQRDVQPPGPGGGLAVEPEEGALPVVMRERGAGPVFPALRLDLDGDVEQGIDLVLGGLVEVDPQLARLPQPAFVAADRLPHVPAQVRVRLSPGRVEVEPGRTGGLLRPAARTFARPRAARWISAITGSSAG